MAVRKALIGAVSITTLAVACSCSEPPDLSSWLDVNMVAFVGRPVSTGPLDKWRSRATFQTEERLWGVLPPGLITVDGARFSAADHGRSWFVLAGRRADSNASYFVSSECCPQGLLLPSDHAWAKEFRDNVAQRKPATVKLEVKSNWISMPGFRLQLSGPGYSWEGISRESAIHLKMPPGEYSVRITNSHFTLQEASSRVSVLPGATTKWWILADPTSSISGTIIGSQRASGQKLHYFLDGEVEVDPEGSLWDSAVGSVRRSWYRVMGWGDPVVRRTSYFVSPDSAGRFQVHVLPGQYRLSVVSGDEHRYAYPPPIPKTYYPGVIEAARASVIVVAPDDQVRNIEFELPDYGPTRRLEVVLVNEDGSPASNMVVAHTGKYPGERFRTAGWTQKLTDSAGRATFDVWQCLEYEIHVSGVVSGESVSFAAGSGRVSRRFVVRRSRPFGEHFR